jgi:hypothetical protein
MSGHMSPHLHQTVTIEPFSSYDLSGNATYSAGSTYPARIEVRRKRVFTAEGNEVTTNLVIYLDNDVSMNSYCKDRITLPVGYYGERQPRILNIMGARDYYGTLDHWEVYT